MGYRETTLPQTTDKPMGSVSNIIETSSKLRKFQISTFSGPVAVELNRENLDSDYTCSVHEVKENV